MKKFGLLLSSAVLAFIPSSYFFAQRRKKRFEEAPQSYLQFKQDKIIQTIDSMLEGLDLEAIRAKRDLILDKSLEELQVAIASGQLSYHDLTAFYLDRIRRIDQKDRGSNAYITINPRALEDASALDLENASEKSMLYGMPVAIKDNIFTQNLATSVGMTILDGYLPNQDATIVQQLKKDKAIILGKANLSELANYVDPHMPSGYSSVGGQTLNPHGPLQISPLGSSSGSATSLVDNTAALAIGTETAGSIVAPAAIQSLVGYKPSHDLIAGAGIFPLVPAMDTAGPMTRTVLDSLHAFNSLSQKVSFDPVLLQEKASLAGARVGLIQSSHPMREELRELLEKAGASVMDIDLPLEGIDLMGVVQAEFKVAVKHFAKDHDLPLTSLADILAYNTQDKKRRARYGQYFLKEAQKVKSYNPDILQQQQTEAQKRLDQILEDHDLDALASFNYEDVTLSALAGYPEITLPLGQDEAGCPQGVTFMGGDKKDFDLLALAYAFEKTYPRRLVLGDRA